jgi:hypothetical protein
MRCRELGEIKTNRWMGEIRIDDLGNPVFEGAAANALEPMPRRLGDRLAAQRVLGEGWSNGELYVCPIPEVPRRSNDC